MFVIQSGFEWVIDVQLAPGLVAVQRGGAWVNGRAEDWEFIRRPNQDPIRNSFLVWEAEVWSNQPGRRPRHFKVDGDDSFGFVLDPRNGSLLYCDPIIGVKRADGKVVVTVSADSDRVEWLTGFAVSSDGARMICTGGWRNANFDNATASGRFLRLFSRGKGSKWAMKREHRYEGDVVEWPAFLPDGNKFIASEAIMTTWASSPGVRSPIRAKVLQVFDADSFARLDTIRHSHRHSEPAHICGTNLVVATATMVHVLDLYDLSRTPIRLVLPTKDISATATDPHGRFLLTASGSSVSVWDPKAWKIAKTYDWKAGAITCLAVAPDGLTAAAGTATGKVVVWDVE